MSAAATTDIAVSGEVNAFLQKNRIAEAFETVWSLVRECYPDLLRLDCWLQADPDEENKSWCVIGVVLPANRDQQIRMEQLHRYHDRLVAEVPFEQARYFAVWTSLSEA